MRKTRLSPRNARWIALSSGVLLLSVAIAAIIGTFGWFGFSSADAAGGRVVGATVVAARACDRTGTGTMETVRFTVDGRDREATLDACGHQPDEPVEVRVGSDAGVVHTAGAAAGESDNGRRLGLVLLVIAGIAGAAYGLLVRRGPRGRPLPLPGRFVPPNTARSGDIRGRR